MSKLNIIQSLTGGIPVDSFSKILHFPANAGGSETLKLLNETISNFIRV
jgi:hypothetical protein